MGAQRLMLVSGTRSAEGAAARAVRAALGQRLVCEAGGVPQHSGVSTVEAIAARAREFRVDGFIAVGGGSASDSAKAAAILLAANPGWGRAGVRFDVLLVDAAGAVRRIADAFRQET